MKISIDSEENNLNDIEKQLHEQYAINNNSNLSSVITLLVTMFAVFGGYGYVYLNSNLDFYGDFTLITNSTYTFDALLITTFATLLVLLIMIHICIYQGYNQRMEQFIIFSIRWEKYNDVSTNKEKIENYLNKEYNNIYPENYHPFSKNKQTFVQGLFGEIIKILHSLILTISIATLLKTFFIEYINECAKVIILTFYTIIALLALSKLLFYTWKYERPYIKYKKRHNNYIEQLQIDNKFKIQ